MRNFDRKLTREKSAIWYAIENSFKTQWEKYKEKVYDMYGHLCLYCHVKNLYEKPLGKTHEGKKSTIYAILG